MPHDEMLQDTKKMLLIDRLITIILIAARAYI